MVLTMRMILIITLSTGSLLELRSSPSEKSHGREPGSLEKELTTGGRERINRSRCVRCWQVYTYAEKEATSEVLQQEPDEALAHPETG